VPDRRLEWTVVGVVLIAIHLVLIPLSREFDYDALPLTYPVASFVALEMLAAGVYLTLLWLIPRSRADGRLVALIFGNDGEPGGSPAGAPRVRSGRSWDWTRWLKPSSDRSKQGLSAGADLGITSKPWSPRRWNGSAGSTIAADRRRAAGGERTSVLSANHRVGRGGLTQTKQSPENPGQFSALDNIGRCMTSWCGRRRRILFESWKLWIDRNSADFVCPW